MASMTSDVIATITFHKPKEVNVERTREWLVRIAGEFEDDLPNMEDMEYEYKLMDVVAGTLERSARDIAVKREPEKL